MTLILGAFPKLRKATINFVMSVCPSAWNKSASTERILIEFYISAFSKTVEKIAGLSKATRAQAHARTRTPTPTHERTYPRARARTHTYICNAYCFSTATMVL